MATKTISLAEDAYERLKAKKRAGESFSDVVRRLTTDVELDEFFGALSDETADEVEAVVEQRRREQDDSHRARVDETAERLHR